MRVPRFPPRDDVPLRIRRALRYGIVGAVIGGLAWELQAMLTPTDFGPVFFIGAPIGAVFGGIIGAAARRPTPASVTPKQPPAA